MRRLPVPLADVDVDEGTELVVRAALMSGGWSGRANIVDRFEHLLASRMDGTVLACSSGTAALHLALLTLGVGPGDEVIVPALTYQTCASVVDAVGATPVFHDVMGTLEMFVGSTPAPEFGGVLPASMAIGPRVKAVIAVHLYGNHAPVEALRSRLPDDVHLIVDCAECFMGPVPEGTMGCYSFFANKELTTGEGGALQLNYPEDHPFIQRALNYRSGGDHGRPGYNPVLPGLNYRMGGLQAALGVGQFRDVQGRISQRRMNAEYYAQEGLIGWGTWLFNARVPEPAKFRERFAPLFETRRLFLPLPSTDAWREEDAAETYPAAHELYESHVSLPTGPHLSRVDQDMIIDAVHDWSGTVRRPKWERSA